MDGCLMSYIGHFKNDMKGGTGMINYLNGDEYRG